MDIISIEVVFDFVRRSTLILGLNDIGGQSTDRGQMTFFGCQTTPFIGGQTTWGSNERLPIPSELP